MNKKVLFLDTLTINSTSQVGSQKYANLFRKNNYEVFSLSHFINIYRFIRRNSGDKELIESWQKGVQTSEKGICFYTSFCILPYLKVPFLDNIRIAGNCSRFCYPSLKKILKKWKFIDIDVLFINNIRLFSVLRFLKAKVIITRISDRIEGFKNRPKTILMLQEKVIKVSDLVFATSNNLQKELKKINKNTFYLPNGVDEDFIMRDDYTYPYPEEYKTIKKPIVLYVGSISDWFDYELYEYGISKLRNISFVMIGPISGVNYRKNLAKIQQYIRAFKNFYYLDSKPHSELRKYLAHADIGVIPFKVDSLTNEINPVKLYEYAAYGLPVVASNTTWMQNNSECISIYNNIEEYVNLISSSLNKKLYLKSKLIEYARRNTWEKRFEFLLSRMKELSR